MEMNYLEYVEKIKGKKVEDINIDEILRADIDYNVELLSVVKTIDSLTELDELFDTMGNIVSYYMEKSIIFFNMIRNYTILEVADGEDIVDNYNIVLEESLKNNCFVKRFYETIKDIRYKENIKAIKELSIAMDNIPKNEEIEEMTNNFSKLFSEENKENLKLLEDIVSFNDPSLKALKEVVYDSATDALVSAEDMNNIRENKE